MLLDPRTWALAPRIDDVLMALSEELGGHVQRRDPRLGARAGDRRARPRRRARSSSSRRCARRLARDLEPLGLLAAASGTHPTAVWTDSVISSGARYQSIYGSMRELARREPTFALHVHVALPSPEMATRSLTRMRAHLPVLLALSANSPFWQGRDTGLASARTPALPGVPARRHPARASTSYSDYIEAIDLLLRCDAFPEPTFLWWDVRLQPRFGTNRGPRDGRPDAGSRTRPPWSRSSSVSCGSRRSRATPPRRSSTRPRCSTRTASWRRATAHRPSSSIPWPGVGARWPSGSTRWWRPARPHAVALGCERELAGVGALLEDPGAVRQRAEAGGPARLAGLVRELAGEFGSSRPELALG